MKPSKSGQNLGAANLGSISPTLILHADFTRTDPKSSKRQSFCAFVICARKICT